MGDYGRVVQFGYFLVPDASSYSQLLSTARRVEQLGLELVGIQDHPYQRRFFDTWTLLSALAAQTSRITLFPDVVNLPLRPPSVLAKAAATLDQISEGRIELGIGAGAFWNGVEAMGGRSRSPGEAVSALEEAIQVIRLMWSGQHSASFNGDHYSLQGVHPGPMPAHDMSIWIGAYGPRMLDLTGRLGDGWIPSSSYLDLAQLPQMQQRIDEAASGAGRSPMQIRRLMNIEGTITRMQDIGFLDGPVERWVEDLTWLVVENGMDSFILMGPAGEQLDHFAQEVAPAVREQVARHRNT